MDKFWAVFFTILATVCWSILVIASTGFGLTPNLLPVNYYVIGVILGVVSMFITGLAILSWMD